MGFGLGIVVVTNRRSLPQGKTTTEREFLEETFSEIMAHILMEQPYIAPQGSVGATEERLCYALRIDFDCNA